MTEQNNELLDEATEAKKRPWLKYVWIALAMLLVAGMSVGITLVATGALDEEAPEAQSAEQGDVTPRAVYMQLNPPFIVSFETEGRQRFLQVELAVMARDQAILNTLTEHMPRTRDNVIQALSSQTFADIRTDPGREQLLTVVRNVLQEIVNEYGDGGTVERVLLRNFVVQ